MKNKFSKNLKNIRKQSNLSQEDMADYLGCERQTVSMYETGKREPSINMLIKIANFFHVSLDDLITDKNDNEEKSFKESIPSFKKIKESPNGTMSYKEMVKTLDLKPWKDTDGIILGKTDNSEDVISTKKGQVNNAVVFGRAGSGKTRVFTLNQIAQAIKNGESVIISEFHNEIYRQTADLFNKNGYVVKVFNCENPQWSDSWNPLCEIYKNAGASQFGRLVSVLVDSLSENFKEDKEDMFLKQSCKNLLHALILFVMLDKSKNETEKTLYSVVDLLNTNDEKMVNSMFERLDSKHPALIYWSGYCALDDILRHETWMLLNMKLKALNDEQMKMLVKQNDIDTKLPASQKCAYFIMMDGTYIEKNYMAAVFIDLILYNIYAYADYSEKNRCDIPVNFLFDDFCVIQKLKNLENMMAIARGKNIRFNIIEQSPSRMKDMYGERWLNILNLSDMIFVAGEIYCFNCEDLIAILDYNGTDDSLHLLRYYPNSDVALIKLRGKQIIVCKKLDYTKNPMYKNHEEANIKEYISIKKEQIV